MATGPEGGRLVQGLAAAGGTERGSSALPGCRAPVRGDLSLRSCPAMGDGCGPAGLRPLPILLLDVLPEQPPARAVEPFRDDRCR